MPTSIDVRRLTDLLPPDRGWQAVVHLPEVDSTNAEALRRDTPWSPVLTEFQTAGRGRLGRDWQEVPGAGLAMSVLVPHVQPPGWMSLIAGLAVRDGLAELGVSAALKWPNDVQLPADGDRKVCGILCQAGGRLSGGVVVGIGINVHHERAELPVDTATSLRLVGVEVDRTELAAAVLTRLGELHAAMSAGGREAKGVLTDYRSACTTIGRRVEVHLPGGGRQVVTATGVDDEGRLVVAGPEGSVTVAAGDVRHVRAVGESPRAGAHHRSTD